MQEAHRGIKTRERPLAVSRRTPSKVLFTVGFNMDQVKHGMRSFLQDFLTVAVYIRKRTVSRQLVAYHSSRDQDDRMNCLYTGSLLDLQAAGGARRNDPHRPNGHLPQIRLELIEY